CLQYLRVSYRTFATGLLWFTDRQKLTEWAKEVKIDPNDPEYSDLMEFIMYARSKEQIVSKYFRLEQLQEEFNFVTEEEIKKCKRFQLLQLRNSEQLDFCYFRQIPLYDREIPDAVIQVFVSSHVWGNMYFSSCLYILISLSLCCR
uniref:Coiled-coil and C2 domain containing 2B n=1 Tax=Chelonoidis abingdonii TaxID=106734 RepID=A0A8C0IZN1_CHEAB